MKPGTFVKLSDSEYGDYRGRVIVCLCKRHTWQPQAGDGGPGTECGHSHCGYPPAASECPWPIHVSWGEGNESHESPQNLTEFV